MAKFELKLPKMGESVAEATITSWLKEVGETIEADEAVLEIATDKVDSEVPSEMEGVLIEKLFEVDDVVQVGQTIAIIETSGEDEAESQDVDVVEDEVPEPEEVEFMEAVAKTLRDFPMINISFQDGKVIKKKNINLGMAAALPDGNLIVPVIKNADQLNLIGMTKNVNDLAKRARVNKLKPDDIQDGTYTVTNVGSFGSIMGTPIINQPQVAILALGAIRKVPAVIETPQGDFIGIRYKMFLSHSYDHRVVNGAQGGLFIKAVKDYLEAWDIDQVI